MISRLTPFSFTFPYNHHSLLGAFVQAWLHRLLFSNQFIFMIRALASSLHVTLPFLQTVGVHGLNALVIWVSNTAHSIVHVQHLNFVTLNHNL